MRKERSEIAIAHLRTNTGQLDTWLPSNPRQWKQTDIDRTAASIREDGDFLEDRPLLVVAIPDTPDFVVFAGNLRLEGCKAAKRAKVPCVVYVPESDEDRATIKRRAMKDNGSFGAWDFDALANEWDDLPLADWGIQAPADWTKADTAAAGSAGTAQEDDFDEDTDEIHVLCAKGDIWQLGEHRLMCGDSVHLADIQKLMGGGVLAKMTFTDPPYGVSIGDKNAMLNTVQPSGRCCKNIENDTLAVPELYDLLRQAMSNVRECSATDATYFVCAPPGGDFGLMMMMMMRDAGLNVRHQIVWRKNAPTFSLGRLDYDYQHEAIMYTWTKSHHNHRRGPFRTSVWDVDKPRKCDLHPTMKPVALVEAAMLDGSAEGEVVLDPFGGSGTTLIVAEQLGRKCRMMEIDPHYCDIIIARWEKLTGMKAVKVTE